LLVITEGESKALAVEQAGYAVIGLPGCWGWVRPRPRAAGGYGKPAAPAELHPDIAGFNLDRPIRLVPDSDHMTTAEVRCAFDRLAQAIGRAR